jgi:predicted regulator of Ras-like GTPase activity (Roadblock/LC7/MglB family)
MSLGARAGIEEVVMAGMRESLGNLLQVEGVNTAVVVGRDGFVIEGTTSVGGIDVEAVAAVISTGLAHSELMGKELKLGGMTQGMVEYEKGVLITSALGEYALLCVVCQIGSNLGMVRLQIKKITPELAEMI